MAPQTTLVLLTPLNMALVLLTLAGIVLLVRGLFPKRHGDTPYCRKCRYNLTGTDLDADDTRCPECGTPVSWLKGIEIGERRVRRGRVALGTLCLLMGLLLLCLRVSGVISNIDWYKLQPTSWLLTDAKSDRAAKAERALAELSRRHTASELSAEQLERLIKICLAEQVRPTPRPRVGQAVLNLLGDLYRADQLSQDQVTRLVENLADCEVDVQARPVVSAGYGIPFSLTGRCRGPEWPFVVLVKVTGAQCNGVTLQMALVGLLVDSHDESAAGTLPPQAPGKHRFSIDIELSVYSELSFMPETLLHTVQLRRTTETEVVLDDPRRLVELVRSPELDSEIPAMIRLNTAYSCESVTQDWDKQAIFVEFVAAELRPVAFAFDARVEFEDQQLPAGTVVFLAGRAGADSRSVYLDLPGDAPKSVNLVLEASVDAAMRDPADVRRIWNGVLRFENVPIEARDILDTSVSDGSGPTRLNLVPTIVPQGTVYSEPGPTSKPYEAAPADP
ncbi:MAG: hypothetical protein ABIG44_16965 [Planctomycetota bacterium]